MMILNLENQPLGEGAQKVGATDCRLVPCFSVETLGEQEALAKPSERRP